MKRIVITGPESTGKSELAIQLAKHYNFTCIPEYAREYIMKLNRPYTKNDILAIARKQIDQYTHIKKSATNAIFDTWLIITKVWLDVVYQSKQEWIDQEIQHADIDLYVLCSTDLPWVPDPLRENGGEMREKLYDMYKQELIRNKLPFVLLYGVGDERFSNAISAIDNYFKGREK